MKSAGRRQRGERHVIGDFCDQLAAARRSRACAAPVAARSRGPERELDLAPDQRARLHMIAVLTHERCHALAAQSGPAEGRRVVLSARERECMRWVAAGKTD
jgi:hypothetical protein